MQEFVLDQSVCTAAICYNSPISLVPTKEQSLREKIMFAKFQDDISYTERLVCVYG